MFFKSRPLAPVRSWSRENGGELLLWSRRRNRRREGCVTMTEIGGYLERSLSSADRERVENHVAECDACRHEMVDLYQLLKAPLDMAPHGLAGDIAASLAEHLPPAGRRRAANGASS